MTKKRTAENDIVVTSGSNAKPARRKTAVRSRSKHSSAPENPSIPAVGPEAADERIAVATTTVAEPVAAAQLSRDRIAQLAYLYWEARGRQGGSSEADWLRAEQELLARG
jgi:hypothetical protein